MTDDFRRDDSSSELVDVIRRGAPPLADEAGAARRARRASASACSSCCCRRTAWSRGDSRPASIITFRIIVGAGAGRAVGYFLVRPLMRQATDEQVALYLEEHEPSLQAAIISAVEAEPRPAWPRPSRRRWCAGWSSRRSRSAARSTAAGASSGEPCAATAATLAAITVAAIAVFVARPGLSAPRAVGAARSSRATSRPPRLTASR